MKARTFITAAALLLAPALARSDSGPEMSGTVFAKTPGKTALRSEPKLDAPARASVVFGQKLVVRNSTSGDPKWLMVAIPGDAAQGWILANATTEKRPGSFDAQPVGASSSKIVASEMTTASAIRGLDGRTAAYAQAKKLEPEVIDQVSRMENFGEVQFDDHHQTDPKGGWHYPDTTARGRWQGAQTFASALGLKPPQPSAPPAPAATPAPAASPKP